MPRMASRIVRARLTPDAEAALRLLIAEGRTESEAVRTALEESAGRRLRRSALRAEVEAAAADPVDIRARRELMEDMESISLDWPE